MRKLFLLSALTTTALMAAPDAGQTATLLPIRSGFQMKRNDVLRIERLAETRKADGAARFTQLTADRVAAASRMAINTFPTQKTAKAGAFHAPMANSTFYGFEMYTNDPSGVLGLYEYTLAGTASLVQPVNTSAVPSSDQGAIVQDGKYIYQCYTINSSSQINGLYYVEIDLATGETSLETLPLSYEYLVFAQALSPEDGKIYVISSDGYDYQFGTLDPETHEVSYIAPVMTDYAPQHLSFTADGTCYAILTTDFSTLILNFDTTTGEYDVTALLDLPTQYATGGAISPETGLYAYHVNTDTELAFYTINPLTGDLVWQSNYTGTGSDVEIVGIAYEAVSAPSADLSQVPARVTDLNLTGRETEDGFEVTVAFTAPSTTADGLTDLTEVIGSLARIDVILNIQGEGLDMVDTVRVRPGRSFSQAYTFAGLGAGQYTAAATPSDMFGDGPSANVVAWLGEDLPGAPRNFFWSVDVDYQWFSLEWSDPAAMHGGADYDLDKVTYTVTRTVNGQDTVVVSDSKSKYFSERLSIVERSKVYYTVTAYIGDKAGGSVVTNTYSLGSYSTPVLFDLASADQFDEFKVVDNNWDGSTWTYNAEYKAARYAYSASYEANDWLFSPAVAVEEGNFYRVEFDTWAQSSSYAERIEAWIGYSQSPYMMVEQFVPAHEVSSISNVAPEHNSAIVRATQSGSLFVGLHAVSEADRFYLYATNIAVSAPIPGTLPRAVSNAVATSDPTGAAKLTLEFDNPMLNLYGDTLEAIGLKIVKDGAVVYDAKTATPGAHSTLVVDGELKTVNAYSIIAYNADGESEAVTVSCYAGFQEPAAPEAIDFELAEGGYTLEWTPVTAGVTGGAVGEVTYGVFCYYTATEAVDTVRNLTGTSYEWIADFSEMGIVQFGVFAENAYGQSAETWSEDVDIAGDPYELPFVENFVDPLTGAAGFAYGFWGATWTTGSGLGAWTLASASSDGDGSCAYFDNSWGDYWGASGAMLFTGKIDASQAEHLVVKYDVYLNPASYYDELSLYVSTDHAKTWQFIQTAYASEFAAAGFQPYQADLSAFAGEKDLILGFYAYDYYGFDIALDNIRLKEPADYDIAMYSLTAPAQVEAPGVAEVVATLSNEGLQTIESGVSVTLFNGADSLQTIDVTEAIAAGEKLDVTFSVDIDRKGPDVYAFKAVVNYEADASPEDNVSETATTIVIKPYLPEATELAATLSEDGTQAVLTWNIPDTTVTAMTVTESFEDYEPGISALGDWTLVDVDGAPTWGVEGGLTFPGAGEAHAWLVFNSDQTGTWATQSGSQTLLSFCPKTYVSADDWLISPELTGEAQTISFYVSQITSQYGNETYEVLYSTTGKDIADFQRIGGVREVTRVISIGYEAVTVELPEGAKYFAIRHTSYDVFGMFLDDITFRTLKKAVDAQILGYNVYADGKKVNDELITGEPTYAVDVTDEEVEYYVTVVYDKGESDPSNTVVLVAETPVLTPDYAVASDDAITDGTTVTSVAGITLTYGYPGTTAPAGWKINADARKFTDAKGDTYAFTAQATGDGNPKNSNDAPTEGVFAEFLAEQSGTLDVAIVANADKAFYLHSTDGEKLTATYYENGEAKTITEGEKFAAKYYGFVTFEVEAGKSYQLYVNGSKMGYYGFNFRSSGSTGIDNAIVDVESGVMYDLYGRRVENAEAGKAYIQGGKAVIKK